MEIKNKLAVEKVFTATSNIPPLILSESSINSDKEFKRNLTSELESISFNPNALSANYFLKNIFKFFVYIILVILTVLILKSSAINPDYWYVVILFFMMGFMFCLGTMKGIAADQPLSDRAFKKIKTICEYNPKAAEHIRNKLLANKPLIQRDVYYLKVPKQINIIERHKRHQLMREMINQQSVAISPKVKEQLNTLKLEEHKTLQWHKNKYKRRVIQAFCLYTAWMVGLFLSIIFALPDALIAVLSVGGMFGFLAVIGVLLTAPALQHSTDKVHLSDYPQLFMLCRIDKRNRDYISKVLAKGGVLLQLDCDSMKFNEQLYILDTEKNKSLVAKQLGIEE